MLKIAVIDDEAGERAKTLSCLQFLQEKEHLEMEIREFSSGAAFLREYDHETDIVLLDIQMSGMDGMETARRLRKIDPSVILIFVTNLAQYAIAGYEYDALDYILKPINPYSFAMKLQRAVDRTAKREDDTVPVRMDRGTVLVRLSEIRYLEVDGHYIIFHTTDGDKVEYTTVKAAEERIRKPYFVRCNQSYLVNLRYVTAIRKDSVFLGAEELQISRPRKKEFMEAFARFIGGGKKV